MSNKVIGNLKVFTGSLITLIYCLATVVKLNIVRYTISLSIQFVLMAEIMLFIGAMFIGMDMIKDGLEILSETRTEEKKHEE